MNFRDEISKALVEQCGIDDEAFIFALDTDGTVAANADPLADAVLNMPEMQALRSLVKEMSVELAMYQNEHSYFGEGVTPSQVIMAAAYDTESPVSVIDWVLSND